MNQFAELLGVLAVRATAASKKSASARSAHEDPRVVRGQPVLRLEALQPWRRGSSGSDCAHLLDQRLARRRSGGRSGSGK